jgi:hypothetical protein
MYRPYQIRVYIIETYTIVSVYYCRFALQLPTYFLGVMRSINSNLGGLLGLSLSDSDNVDHSAASLQLSAHFVVSVKNTLLKFAPGEFVEPLFGSNPPGGDCKLSQSRLTF